MTEHSQIIFKESQSFKQWWVWILVLIGPVFSWYGAYHQLILKKPFGDNPTSDTGMLIIFIVFGILFPVFFLSIKLLTEVRYNGVYIKYFPFHLSFRKIASSHEVKVYESRIYSAMKEYGGYGIRFGKKGKAYNVSGNRGIQFELLNGKKILIGTQKPDDFLRAMTLCGFMGSGQAAATTSISET